MSGTEVTFDALVFGPDGPGGSAMLSVCGLDPEVRADISDVSCFADRSRVTELGEVPGLAWTPPALSFDCEEGDTVEFGGACSTRVVMLATPDTDGRLASFGASIGADAAAVGKPLVALADSPPVIELEATEVDGAVLLTTTVELGGLAELVGVVPDSSLDPYALAFRWTVTGGTLDETGRTLLDSADGTTVTSVNTWHPEGAGAQVAVVVAPSSFYVYDTGPLLWWAVAEAP